MLKTHIATIAAGTDLDAEAAADAFNIIMSGDATPSRCRTGSSTPTT